MSTYPVTFECNGEVFVAHNASEANIYYVWECGQNYAIPYLTTSFTNTITAPSAKPTSGEATITWPTVEENPFPVTLPCGSESLVVNGSYSDLEAAYECGIQVAVADAKSDQTKTSGAGTTSVTLSGLLVALIALSVFV